MTTPTSPPRFATATRILACAAGLAALGLVGCGPAVTEPVPDIPQTVEYETVRIEYGDDDLIGGGDPGVVRQALVGDPSLLAGITRQTVRGTNAAIRDTFRLIDAITAFPPTAHEGNLWVWESREERPDSADYLRFVIEETGEDQFRYLLSGGPTEADANDLFGGEFTSFGRRDGRQEGTGVIFFDFDAARTSDPSARPAGGKIVIAFRSANFVRQVRTGFYEVPNDGGIPVSAIFNYTQFARGGGTFTFFSRADVLEDGEPLEFLAIRSAWRPDLAGRAAARITEGSLELNEVILRECWDEGAATLYADSQPDFPNYDDGDPADCRSMPRAFEDVPPVYRDPGNDDPQVPGPHPEEVDVAEEPNR